MDSSGTLMDGSDTRRHRVLSRARGFSAMSALSDVLSDDGWGGSDDGHVSARLRNKRTNSALSRLSIGSMSMEGGARLSRQRSLANEKRRRHSTLEGDVTGNARSHEAPPPRLPSREQHGAMQRARHVFEHATSADAGSMWERGTDEHQYRSMALASVEEDNSESGRYDGPMSRLGRDGEEHEDEEDEDAMIRTRRTVSLPVEVIASSAWQENPGLDPWASGEESVGLEAVGDMAFGIEARLEPWETMTGSMTQPPAQMGSVLTLSQLAELCSGATPAKSGGSGGGGGRP